MRLRSHIIYSSVPTIILAPFVGVQALVFFAGAVLIDADHYIQYILKFKDFGVKGMFDFVDSITKNVKHEKGKPQYLGLCLFHTVEFFILLGILSFHYTTVRYLLLGMSFHMTLDIIHLYRHSRISSRALSLIEYFIRIGNYKKVKEFDKFWYEGYRNSIQPKMHQLTADGGAND